MHIPTASNELNEAAGRSPGPLPGKEGSGQGGAIGGAPQPWLGAAGPDRGWERAMERVGGTAAMPVSGQEGSGAGARPTTGPSGDKLSPGALPGNGGRAGGLFSSLPALVTAHTNPVPTAPNGP